MTLQEYLIKLGFSVDDPSMKKFIGAISAAGARTSELGAAALETATAVELMVSRVARNYETLYYMSQRTGQSVRYIQSTQFAFKQIGLTAEDANQSIEGIASTLRTQPWLKAIFGGANTPQQVATNLGRSGLPYFLQVKFAEMIGLSETTLFQMQKFSQVEADAQADFKKRQREAGFDPDAFAKGPALDFSRALTKLESDLDIFGDRMAADLIDPTMKGINAMDSMVQWLNRLDNATKGWLGTLEAIGGSAAGLFLIEKILRRMLGLSSTTLVGRLLGMGLVTGGAAAAAAVGGVMALEAVKENDPATKSYLRKLLGPALYELGLSKSPNLTGEGDGGGGGPVSGSLAKQRAGFMKELDADPQLKNFAINAMGKEGGVQSNLEQLFNYAAMRKMTIRQALGSGQYGPVNRGLVNASPASAANLAALAKVGAGSNITDYATDQGMAGDPNYAKYMANPERYGMHKVQGAWFSAHGEQGVAWAQQERAAALTDHLSSLVPQQSVDSSKNVTLNAKTDINIHGGGDPSKAIKGYTDAHQDVNDSLIYQLQQPFR